MTIEESSAEYSAEIRALVSKGDAITASAMPYFWRAGKKLIAAKSELQHGQWLPFLQECELSRFRSAELMRIAGHLTKREAEKFGSMRAALREVSRRNTYSPSSIDQKTGILALTFGSVEALRASLGKPADPLCLCPSCSNDYCFERVTEALDALDYRQLSAEEEEATVETMEAALVGMKRYAARVSRLVERTEDRLRQ